MKGKLIDTFYNSHNMHSLKTNNKMKYCDNEGGFKPRTYSKNDYAEIKGIPFVLPKQPTQVQPFNLSSSNMKSKEKRENAHKRSPPNFDTYVESVSKNQKWPVGGSTEKVAKRRSVSQEFKRDSKLDVHQGFRVTFMGRPGEKCTVPLRTEFRAQSRCEQCHGHLDSIPEAPYRFKARNMPNTKEFVLKKPVFKPTVPMEPKLKTNVRSSRREEYARKAEEYRKELKQRAEDNIERRRKDKTPTFNLNF